MASNELWLPIISTVVSWVKENLGPSKKELKIQLKDLQEQVVALAKGNAAILDNMGMIIRAILSELKADNQYVINAEQIVYIDSNSGSINPICSTTKIEGLPVTTQKNSDYHYENFFVTDEEIALSRSKYRERIDE